MMAGRIEAGAHVFPSSQPEVAASADAHDLEARLNGPAVSSRPVLGGSGEPEGAVTAPSETCPR